MTVDPSYVYTSKYAREGGREGEQERRRKRCGVSHRMEMKQIKKYIRL